MQFHIATLARLADSVDLSDITSAKRTGPARWVGPGVLDIPFDRDLTAAEAAAVEARLSSADPNQEALRLLSTAYLATASPTAAASAAQVKRLTRVVLALLDNPQQQ